MRLYKDNKYSCWEREYYTVDTKDKKEAIRQILDGEADMDYSETLYETFESLDPTDNGGEATEEIYTDNGKMIWDNGVLSKQK